MWFMGKAMPAKQASYTSSHWQAPSFYIHAKILQLYETEFIMKTTLDVLS